jgi:hypothetical protein
MTDATAMPTPVAGSPFKVRSPAAVIIFSIISFGIYAIYWYYQVGREMKEYNGSGLGPVANLLLGLFFAIVLLFTIPNDVKATYEAAGKQTDISALTGFWNLIPIVGWIIWVVKVQGRLNTLWEQAP